MPVFRPESIPEDFESGNVFTFLRSHFSPEEDGLKLDDLSIAVGTKSYNPSPDLIDWLIFSGSYSDYRHLGWMFLRSTFVIGRSEIKLGKRKSKVKNIILESYEDKQVFQNLLLKAESFDYSPTKYSSAHPFSESKPDPPLSVNLVYEDSPFYLPRERYDERETLFVLGSPAAFAYMGEFFLNVGIESQEISEYSLERDFAFCGVSNMSAELRIYTEKNEFYQR